MILYFSATGNTRFVAEELAARLGDSSLDLLEKLRRGDHAPLFSEKPFVICSPVYVCEPPRFLMSFLRKTPLNGNRDVYFVFTSGGYSGISSILARNLACRKEMRYRGSADFKMPRNYIISDAYPPNSPEEIEARIRQSQQKLPETAATIQAGGALRSRHVWLFELLITLPFTPVWSRFHQRVSSFFADDRCISCGKCESGCPLKVIIMRDGKPEWTGKSCSHCMACIQNCPTQAIQYGDKTRTRPRYRFALYRHLLK